MLFRSEGCDSRQGADRYNDEVQIQEERRRKNAGATAQVCDEECPRDDEAPHLLVGNEPIEL